jgi:nucleotide-binding universal stress UspA family protein
MFKHILIPSDGSEIANKAVQRGMALAKSLGAKVTLLHVSPTFRRMMDEGYLVGPNLGRAAWEQSMDSRAQGIFDAAGADARKAGVKYATIHVYNSNTHGAIIDAATKAGCDVIVMGSHGYGAVKGAMIGSETTRVLSNSKIPVLVIR